MLRAQLLALVPLLAAAAATQACVARNDAQLASDSSGAEDVAGTESDVESLGTSLVGSDGESLATQSLAGGDVTVSSGNPGYYFQPAGCIQATADTTKQTVTYVFSSCTGPLGLVALNGTVTADWQLAGDQLTVDFAASGFQVNRATIDSWQATAVITTTGNQRSMSWNASLSGTTGRGRAFTRTNQKNVSWTIGVPCIAASGQSTGDILGADLQTSVVSWQRCAEACPQSGSEISVKNLDKGDSIDIKYNGGDSAEMTVDGGRSIEIGLACGL
ncbi:MAG TPA: hypothetical protein VGG39_34170 [Polyangiaceae bacterium]|jgi:hypothetical protein